MKKVDSPFYAHLDEETGEMNHIDPEYLTMSRGQEKDSHGIGYNWYQRYKDETYRDDYVVIDGQKYRPPRYYDSLLEKEDPARYEEIKDRRRSYTEANQHNLEDARQQAKAVILKSRLNNLKRAL